MARLTEAARQQIPKSKFAIPAQDAYPINTPQRARVALGLVGMHGSPAEKTAVRAKVRQQYPDIEQSRGPQAKRNNGNGNGNGVRRAKNGDDDDRKRNGKSNGNGNGRNGNGRNGNGNGERRPGALTTRLSKELGRRLDARDDRR